MKRGTSGYCGVLAIDKPQGITSHDVVSTVRRVLGERRVGHAGTLDPMATGLLLVCVGAATRLSPYLTGHDKSYVARIVFGVGTDTDDAEGRVATAFSKSAPGQGLHVLPELNPQEVLDSITGTCMQLPPAYSAIKKNGVTAYKAAREGKEIQLDPREITIYDAVFVGSGSELVDLDDGQGGRFKAELPYWDVRLSVSKGTYIRSIARDLGQRLGCGAHLSALRRTSIADCTLEGAITLDVLVQLAVDGKEIPWSDPVQLLGLDETRYLSEAEMKDVSNGRNLAAEGADGLVACVRDGRLMAIYNQAEGVARPQTVIPGGVVGVAAEQSRKAPVITWDPLADDAEYLGRRVIAMGVFDGVHAGHKTLLAAAKSDADEKGLPLTILTFEKDPDEYFGRAPESFKLMSDARRLSCLANSSITGANEVVALKLHDEFLSLEPEEFLDKLQELFEVASIHVGKDFRFGRKAAGTVADIQRWGAAHGAECCPQELFEIDSEAVTASRIRALLAKGDVDDVAKLDSEYMVYGEVVHGRGEGTGMGFATANIEPEADIILPAEGVYGGLAFLEGKCFAVAINMGVAKSFDNATAPIEAHLLDYDGGDFYGKTVAVKFMHWLRPQRKFDDMDELVATVKGDIAWVRDNLCGIATSCEKGR